MSDMTSNHARRGTGLAGPLARSAQAEDAKRRRGVL